MVTAEITISKEQLLSFTQPMQFVGIDWQTYEAISDELGESSPIHLSYEKGILTIMPITKLHETLVRLLERLIGIVSLVKGLEIVPTGSATLRSRSRSIGVEPDLSFFFEKVPPNKNAPYVESETDFPPDIVVEIDINHRFDEKFSTYAELGIPEFWRYDGAKFHIYSLDDDSRYERLSESSLIPVLSSALLTEFLDRGKSDERQAELLLDFQARLQNAK